MTQTRDKREFKFSRAHPAQGGQSPGDSWFLGVGINDYAEFPKLNNAVADVSAIQAVLIERYGLEPEHCITLFNEQADEENLIQTLDEFTDSIGEHDSLLIYYSGHGHLNKKTEMGFWIPQDAKKGKTASYIRNSTIRDYLKAIPSLHTLLISDSCYSASLFIQGTHRSTGALNELGTIPSRWAICSGRADQEVYDGVPGSHSPFAKSILDVLEGNQADLLNVSKLADRVIEQTKSNFEQLPDGRPLHNVGHKGGQYIFRLKAPEDDVWEKSLAANTVEAFSRYLRKFPKGKFADQANRHIQTLDDDRGWDRARRSHTLSAYHLYLRSYPKGRHRDQAKQQIVTLEKAVITNDLPRPPNLPESPPASSPDSSPSPRPLGLLDSQKAGHSADQNADKAPPKAAPDRPLAAGLGRLLKRKTRSVWVAFKRMMVLAGVMLLVTLGVMIYHVIAGTVMVPNLIGTSEGQAYDQIFQSGLQLGVVRYVEDAPAGQVIGQSPAAGRSVRADSNVDLQVGGGDAPVSITGLQNNLKSLGYDPGTVDGALGARTVRAIKAFQRAAGMPPSGRASLALLNTTEAAMNSGELYNFLGCEDVATTREQPTTERVCSDQAVTTTETDYVTTQPSGCAVNPYAFGGDFGAMATYCEELAATSYQAVWQQGLAAMCQQQYAYAGGGVSLTDLDVTCQCNLMGCYCQGEGECSYQVTNMEQQCTNQSSFKSVRNTREVCYCRAPDVAARDCQRRLGDS